MVLIKGFMTNDIPPSPCRGHDKRNSPTPRKPARSARCSVSGMHIHVRIQGGQNPRKHDLLSHELAIKVNALRGILLLRYVSWDDGFGKLLDQFLSAD